MKTAGKFVWTMGVAGIVLSSFMVSCSEENRNVRDRDRYDEAAPDVDRDRDFDMNRDRDADVEIRDHDYDTDQDMNRDDADVSVEVRDYRMRTETQLDENDAKIDEYRAKIDESDDPSYRAKYEGRIDALEEENEELRARLRGYNKEKDGNWDSFKREFEHDMDELGTAIKGLFKDEKK